MTTLLEDFGRSRVTVFRMLLQKSNEFFAPLSDPLACDLGLHSWLRSQREESYTMWLQWALQQLDTQALFSTLGLNTSQRVGTATIEIEREVPIAYQDGFGHGRLDLSIRQGSDIICIVEIKTKPFLDEHLEKQQSYSDSPLVAPGTERIFIAADANGCDLRGFRFLPWSQLCIQLRRLAPEVAATKNPLSAGLLLAFVGAVEQNLLGLAHSEKDLRALPVTVNHLTEFHRGNDGK